MADDAAVLLRAPRQEAGHVDEGDDRNVEGVAEANEARRLGRGVDVEAARELLRLVGYHAHRRALHSAEASDDVLCEIGRDLEQIAVVKHAPHQRAHVVRNVRVLLRGRAESWG